MKLTFAAVRADLAEQAPAIAIRKESGGEYRATFKLEAIAAAFPGLSRKEQTDKAESLAAYETDLESVLATGLAMARVGFPAEVTERLPAPPLGPVSEAEKAARDSAPLILSPVRVNLQRQVAGTAEIANREAGKLGGPGVRRVINVTPTWAGILPLLLAAIENGTAEGRQIAWAELARMAELADSHVAAQSALAALGKESGK